MALITWDNATELLIDAGVKAAALPSVKSESYISAVQGSIPNPYLHVVMTSGDVEIIPLAQGWQRIGPLLRIPGQTTSGTAVAEIEDADIDYYMLVSGPKWARIEKSAMTLTGTIPLGAYTAVIGNIDINTPFFGNDPIVVTNGSIDVAVNDMKLTNDVYVPGINQNAKWASQSVVGMGNIPRGTNTPTWWNPTNTAYKSSTYWNALESWFVLFIGQGHSATNVRVQCRDAKVHIKSTATGLWTTVGTSHTVSGEIYNASLQGGALGSADIRSEVDGTISVLAPSDGTLFHGYGLGRTTITGSDVAAACATMQARLVLDNTGGTDDRSSAKLQIHSGLDWYPNGSTNVQTDFAPTGYNPGAGISRMKLVTNEWQDFTFWTADGTVTAQEPGGGISEAAFRANPPPGFQ